MLASADPVSFVRGLDEPVVIDEFQRVPDLLSAIKAELNRDRRPGRFVLAGSARHDAVPQLADFLTGRVEVLQLWPFAMAELASNPPSVIDRWFGGETPGRRTTALTRAEVVDVVLRGGYPIAVALDGDARGRWLSSLATLVVERLAQDVASIRHTAAARKMLRLAAAGTSQTRNAAELGREIGLGRDQASVYLGLLGLAYLVLELPAWSTNLTARVTKRPKIHLTDSGLASRLQGITADRLSPLDPAGAARFGPLLETFVVMEVVKQLGWSQTECTAHHYRTSDGVEVDLVLEAADGRVVAVEVKAGGSVPTGSLSGLRSLRDRLGDLFVAGVLLNTGNQAQRLEDRLHVAPVDELWTAGTDSHRGIG